MILAEHCVGADTPEGQHCSHRRERPRTNAEVLSHCLAARGAATHALQTISNMYTAHLVVSDIGYKTQVLL